MKQSVLWDIFFTSQFLFLRGLRVGGWRSTGLINPIHVNDRGRVAGQGRRQGGSGGRSGGQGERGQGVLAVSVTGDQGVVHKNLFFGTLAGFGAESLSLPCQLRVCLWRGRSVDLVVEFVDEIGESRGVERGRGFGGVGGRRGLGDDRLRFGNGGADWARDAVLAEVLFSDRRILFLLFRLSSRANNNKCI